MTKNFMILKIAFLAIVSLVFFSGCGSMYNYDVKPTPIKKAQSKYVVNNFDLTLDDSAKNPLNETYKNESELKESFESFLTEALKNKGLFSEDGYKVDITLFYSRVFNYGGNTLNKPQFYYTVKVLDKNNTQLASFSIPRSTTKYSYFKDIAVNLQIGTFNRKAENEPEDIELISKTLVNELSELGD
ncbi:hypothetical protein [Halarcobacter ebronensis]|uniref:Uncharacterized protein n=1 Tax=Halarcobacter ebronensis TaxID=1462615 RepID=A0A4Q1AVH1_9BACT|nr:hypothetical protein [Halarcobacter ebronensis]QKF83393.1 hypothetical protein AEBR_2942 [Halarcobacter ebronensis]RXK05953.1 hypothetical protein CRV07_07730 [Halarcobacter ebronensis]